MSYLCSHTPPHQARARGGLTMNYDENSEEYKERERRAILAKIKQIGVPLEEIRAVIDEQDALRSHQFANVVKQIRAAKTDHEIGLILRSFAEYIIEEARIGGIRA